MNQVAQIESAEKKINHIIFSEHARFQASKFLRPNPPSSFEWQHDSHDTFAEAAAVISPFQRNFAQRESISWMTLYGSMKELVQKLVIPFITDVTSCILPA